MSTFWVVFVVFFVVGPATRWGLRAGRLGYRRGRGYRFGVLGSDDGVGQIDPHRLEELMSTVEQRNQDVELLQSRVNELENRLDFAERLLAERRNVEITGG